MNVYGGRKERSGREEGELIALLQRNVHVHGHVE
jgi:hypothetical protein